VPRLVDLAEELFIVKEFYKAQEINLNWGVNQTEAESVAALIVKHRMACANEVGMTWHNTKGMTPCKASGLAALARGLDTLQSKQCKALQAGTLLQ
jgi:hypothetical protein